MIDINQRDHQASKINFNTRQTLVGLAKKIWIATISVFFFLWCVKYYWNSTKKDTRIKTEPDQTICYSFLVNSRKFMYWSRYTNILLFHQNYRLCRHLFLTLEKWSLYPPKQALIPCLPDGQKMQSGIVFHLCFSLLGTLRTCQISNRPLYQCYQRRKAENNFKVRGGFKRK